jgi:hypothetical protein
MFERFIEWMDYEWKVKGLEHLMAFISKKYSIKVDDLMTDANDFVKVRNAEVKETDVHEQYQIFLLKNEKDLQELYDNKVDFRTNIRGVKVRRCFSSVEETQLFAKVLQRRYPKDNLYIGKVGAWLPWDPSEHLMPEVETIFMAPSASQQYTSSTLVREITLLGGEVEPWVTPEVLRRLMAKKQAAA